MTIYETENFKLFPMPRPHVSREEGGHLKLAVKGDYADLTEAPPKYLVEYIRILALAGDALKVAMNNRGVPVIWVNYQVMGNWAFRPERVARGDKPHFHAHIYGRVADARKQIWPEAVQLPPRDSGFYDEFVPINDEDVAEIKRQIKKLEQTEKFRKEIWRIK